MTAATQVQIETARTMYQSREIEIDDLALTSLSDSGMWVQAWVFIPKEQDDE